MNGKPAAFSCSWFLIMLLVILAGAALMCWALLYFRSWLY